jgi:hypothetical protein
VKYRRLVLLGASVLSGAIAVMLLLGCDGDARPSVDAYVAAIRAGTAAEGEDADAKATREAIVKSRKVSIDNWAEHHDSSTGCYWGSLAMPDGKDVPIRLFVQAHDGAWHVARASVTRRCQCSRTTNPCFMDE